MGKWRGGFWRSLGVGLLGVLLLAFPSFASAACTTQALPEVTIRPESASTGWCVTGSVVSGAEPHITFTVPVAGLWQASLEALPGQDGLALMAIQGDNGPRQIWQAATRRAEGTATSPLLFLAAGTYSVAVETPGAALVYRLALNPGPGLPPDLTSPVTGAFSAVVRGTDEKSVTSWAVDQNSTDQLWTIAAQGAVGLSMSLAVLDASGTTILSTSSPDEAGVFRLPDLQLATGIYQLVVSGLPGEVPVFLGAEQQARPAGFAAEPDGHPEQAHRIEPSQPITGRLITEGSYGEHDYFVLTVPGGPEAPGYDINLSAPTPASLSLVLLGADGTTLLQRDGQRQVVLHSLRLTPGDHVIEVSGALPADTVYSLQVSEIGPPAAGFEIEPNDVPSSASALPASHVIAGDFDDGDRDFLDLAVASGLQLWQIEAIGEGIDSLDLYDGAGQVIRSSVPSGKRPRVLFSHLLLPPGHNVLRLSGQSGNWLLRADPIGPPVDGQEIEPDDDPTRAIPIVVGQKQLGWLEEADDRDLYAFHVGAPERLTLAIDAAAELAVRARLLWGDRGDQIAQPATTGIPGAPQQLRWSALLQAGDYFIELASNGGTSREPYALRLDPAPYFSRPLDLEPNDADWQAVALPAGQQLDGVIQGDQDTDWYAPDGGFLPGTLDIRAVSVSGSLSLQLETAAVPPEIIQRIDLYNAGDTATLTLPARPVLLRVTGGPGPYSINLGGGTQPASAPLVADAALSFEAGPVAAYEAVAQRLDGRLSIHNAGSDALMLRLASWVGDERWHFEGLPETIVVDSAGNVAIPVTLEIPADARDDFPVYAEVAVTGPTGTMLATARTAIPVSTGVLPVGPHPYQPYPATMLGGLNVASGDFGAVIDNSALAGLIDGVVDVDGVSLALTDAPAITLAGTGDIPIAGVILQPPAGGSVTERLADFAVEVARDGADFTRVLTARLSPVAREQAFLLPPDTAARAVRLVPLSAQGGPAVDRGRLAEFAVITKPDFVLQGQGFDIASPALGGHIVRAAGFGQQALTGEQAAWPGDRPVLSPPDRESSPQWTVGFRNGRSAHISTLIWHERPDTPPEQRITSVELFAGADGPLGPWVSLGIFNIGARPDESLTLPTPVWARALSFRVVAPPRGPLALPASIEVREAPGPSILGTWGDLDSTGPFEAQLSLGPETAALPSASGDPLAPTALAMGSEARGAVRRGESEAWYEIELPQGTRMLRAQFADDLAPDVSLTLVGADGAEVPMETDPGVRGGLSAAAGPGRWRLHVVQPLASVVVAWDTSGSVSGLFPVVSRMIRQLAWQLDPDREQINLVPFRDTASGFLMPEWSSSRADVFSAMHAYPLNDNSSDAEDALLFSVSKLAERVGRRAVVLVTDASYSGVYANEQLWANFERARVGVFALYLPADADPIRVRAQTNLMSDWASAGSGQMSRFAAQGDSQIAFRRVQAWLDRPARYSFALSADTTPPEPGRLRVELGNAAETTPADGAATKRPLAMEIILDASGSMLRRIGASRRIDIAKDVLTKLGRTVLPDNLPVALRVFGHDRPDSCDNELLVPLSPLDRESFVSAIGRVKSINRARTSIANTLRQAGKDLAGTAETAIIVLITDGEETCGGSPLDEIEAIRSEGISVKLNIVGFAIDDAEIRSLLHSWAVAGGGEYFVASDGQALAAATSLATALLYTVFDRAGAQVASGVVGGTAVELPPGRYVARVGQAELVVNLKSGETQSLLVP